MNRSRLTGAGQRTAARAQPRILRCAVCIVAGLITSIAIAWGADYREQMQTRLAWRLGQGIDVIDEVVVWMSLGEHPGVRVTRWHLADTSAPGPQQEGYRRIAERIAEIGSTAYAAEVEAANEAAIQADPSIALPKDLPLIYRIDEQAARGPPQGLGEIGEAGSHIERRDAGWPLPALRSEERSDFGPAIGAGMLPRHEVRMAHRYALILPRDRPGVRLLTGKADPATLPLRPLPGLPINVLFFATLWGAVLFGPGAMRRTWRRAKGRCFRCGYSLVGQAAPGCPECGTGRSTRP